MSHEITSEDGPVFVGRPAWHGLGLVMPEGRLEPERAMRLAGLDWSVLLEDLRTDQGRPLPGRRATVRADTGRVLGVVTNGYEPIQNRAMFGVLQALGRPVESAGSLQGGRTVFALLRQGAFQVGPTNDAVHQFLLAVTSHDGSRAMTFLPTDVRVECANKLARALGADTPRVHLVHRTGAAEMMERAALSLERAEALVSLQRDQTLALADTAWSPGLQREFYREQASAILGATAAAALDPLVERKVSALAAMFADAEAHPHQASLPATGWRSFQAVSHWAHHVRRSRLDPVSAAVGPVGAIVRRAFGAALALK